MYLTRFLERLAKLAGGERQPVPRWREIDDGLVGEVAETSGAMRS